MCKCHEQHCDCGCSCDCHRHGRQHGECECECREHTCDCECHGSGHSKHHGGECGCGKHACACERGEKFERRFATRAERIAQLEAYLQDLKTEIQAVEEHLAEFKAAE